MKYISLFLGSGTYICMESMQVFLWTYDEFFWVLQEYLEYICMLLVSFILLIALFLSFMPSILNWGNMSIKNKQMHKQHMTFFWHADISIKPWELLLKFDLGKLHCYVYLIYLSSFFFFHTDTVNSFMNVHCCASIKLFIFGFLFFFSLWFLCFFKNLAFR